MPSPDNPAAAEAIAERIRRDGITASEPGFQLCHLCPCDGGATPEPSLFEAGNASIGRSEYRIGSVAATMALAAIRGNSEMTMISPDVATRLKPDTIAVIKLIYEDLCNLQADRNVLIISDARTPDYIVIDLTDVNGESGCGFLWDPDRNDWKSSWTFLPPAQPGILVPRGRGNGSINVDGTLLYHPIYHEKPDSPDVRGRSPGENRG